MQSNYDNAEKLLETEIGFGRISQGWQRELLLWSTGFVVIFCLVLNLTEIIALLFQE